MTNGRQGCRPLLFMLKASPHLPCGLPGVLSMFLRSAVVASPRRRAVACAALLACLLTAPAFAAKPAAAPALEREAQRLVAMLPGEVGVSMLHLPSGRAVHVNADRAFPLASVMKVPVAVHILKLVDEGTLSLTQNVVIGPDDIYPEMGGPMDIHLSAGSAINVRDLLHMMITVSDNNATDMLIKLGGGTAAINARMQQLGINDVRIDRYIWELLANYQGHPASQKQPISPDDYATLDRFIRAPDVRRRDTDAWNADPRDTGSTRALATLLRQVWAGKLLSGESTDVLKGIMAQTRTGNGRLRGVLPPGTKVANKTGTVGDVINDVGVITLPDGKGEVVIAVLMASNTDTATRDRTIANLARAAHDYFLFVE
jgi:beta-lactamase class A